MVIAREGRRLDAGLAGGPRDRPIVETGRQAADQMHARGRRRDRQALAHTVAQGCDQNRLALGVEGAHAADVGRQMTLADEIDQGRLGDRRGVGIDQRPDREEGVDQLLGHHHVADPQARKHDLAHGADVDHPAIAIEALEGRERPPGVAVLAVVVVLEHEAAGRARPLQELEAALQAHRDPERELVRGRDRDQPRRRLEAAALDHAQTLVIDRHRHRSRPGREQHGPGRRVARLLDPDRIAGVDQHPGGEVERLLGARDHDHLLRAAGDRPRARQIVGDRLTERPVAGRVAADQEGTPGSAPATREQARPIIERELLEFGHAGREGARPRAAAVQPGEAGAAERRPGSLGTAVRALSGLRARARHHRRQTVRDERAGADPAVDVALGVQLLERRHHGVARDRELTRQPPGRRQPHPRPQRAVQDGVADREVDLAMQRLGGGAFDLERRGERAGGAFGHHDLAELAQPRVNGTII